MSSLDDLTCAVVLLAGTVAGAYDLCQMRIPNRLVATLLASGLLYQGMLQAAWGASLLGIILGGGLLLPLYLRGGMGAGDIKLAAAIGAWWGPALTIEVILNAALLAGVWAVALILLRQLPSFRPMTPLVVDVNGLHRTDSPALIPSARLAAIPFAAAMAIALDIVALGWRWQSWS